MKIFKIKNLSAKKALTRSLLVFTSLVMIVTIPIQLFNQPTLADQYDDKIQALQNQINAYNAQAQQLSQQSQTLQVAVDALQAQVSAMQAKIDISQAKYDQLVSQIADTEKKISENKDALGVTIAKMYVDGEVTPIEMLASSGSIGDYLDAQEYQSSIRDQLTNTINTVKSLKVQLEQQKIDAETILNQQKTERASLAASQAEQQSLLSQTQSNEAVYQQLMASSRQKIADVASQQRSYYQSLLNSGRDGSSGVAGAFQYKNWSGNMGCGSDGYPYCGVQDAYSDPWQLYNRECVSYAAWALYYRYNKDVNPFHGYGNAWEWAEYEFNDGKVGSAVEFSDAFRVSDPQPGDAVVLPAMSGFSPIGHLMIVESVGDDGWIHVSQYNFYGTGEYSTMDIKSSGVYFMRFRDR